MKSQPPCDGKGRACALDGCTRATPRGRRWCSPAHRAAAIKARQVTRPCKGCGVVFTPQVIQVQKGTGWYHNNECKRKSLGHGYIVGGVRVTLDVMARVAGTTAAAIHERCSSANVSHDHEVPARVLLPHSLYGRAPNRPRT